MENEQTDAGAEHVTRDQIVRRERGQGCIQFPCSADHKQDGQLYPVDPHSALICDGKKKYIYCSTRPIYPVLYNARIQYALNEWPTTPRNRLHSCIFATTSEESCEIDPTGHKRLHILKDTTVCIFYYRREADLFGTSGCCCCCCCCCCFPHSACCLPTRKTTLHGG